MPFKDNRAGEKFVLVRRLCLHFTDGRARSHPLQERGQPHQRRSILHICSYPGPSSRKQLVEPQGPSAPQNTWRKSRPTRDFASTKRSLKSLLQLVTRPSSVEPSLTLAYFLFRACMSPCHYPAKMPPSNRLFLHRKHVVYKGSRDKR